MPTYNLHLTQHHLPYPGWNHHCQKRPRRSLIIPLYGVTTYVTVAAVDMCACDTRMHVWLLLVYVYIVNLCCHSTQVDHQPLTVSHDAGTALVVEPHPDRQHVHAPSTSGSDAATVNVVKVVIPVMSNVILMVAISLSVCCASCCRSYALPRCCY